MPAYNTYFANDEVDDVCSFKKWMLIAQCGQAEPASWNTSRLVLKAL